MNIRAGMWRQFLLFFKLLGLVCAVDLVARKAFRVILSEKLGFIIVVLSSSWALGQAQDTLVRVNSRDIIASVDGGRGIRNQVVSHVAESLHVER
jgi:hypothetical protein